MIKSDVSRREFMSTTGKLSAGVLAAGHWVHAKGRKICSGRRRVRGQ